MDEKLKNTLAGMGCKALGGTFRAIGKYALRGKRVCTPERGSFDKTEAASKFFTVGFGKQSILPSDTALKPYYIAGYGENNPAIGVLDAPYAHALWIDDCGGKGGILFVSVDCVGISNYDVNAIRRAIRENVKLPKCRSINIMATHNHAGIDTLGAWGKLPKTGKDKAYLAFVTVSICHAVAAAVFERTEGVLYRGEIEVPDMQEDIRLPEVYSKTLTRLRFVPNNGSRETWFVNFASHSEYLQGCNSRVSADFPGYFREKIREQTGAEVFYCVGAIGGMISMLIENEDEIRAAGGDFYESTRSIGRRLADYALSISEETVVEPRIGFMRQRFFVDVDNLVLILAGLAKVIDSEEYSSKSAEKNLAIMTELSYFELGDTKILALPGELFPELAYGGYLSEEESAQGKSPDINPTPLCDIIRDKKLLFLGLCNDEIGYILPPNDFMLNPVTPYIDRVFDRHGRKHYEEQNSLGVNTAPTIARTFGEMVTEIRKVK